MGEVCMLPEGLRCCLGQRMVLLRPNLKKVDGRYLLYALQSPEVRRQILIHEGTGSTVSNLRIPALEALPIPFPPLSEQRRIAGILGALDDKIELNRKMNRTLEDMAQAIFKSWFIDFDGHTDFEDSPLGPIPRGWKVGRLGDEFNLVMGQSPPGETYNEEGIGLPFYQGGTDFGFRFPTRRIFCSEPKRVANAGDTLISVRAPVGRPNMASELCCLGRGVGAMRHKSGSISYTYAVAKSLESHFEVFNSEGTIFGSINKNDFGKIPALLPPLAKVAEFEKVVSSLDRRLENNWRETSNLEQLRYNLLIRLIRCNLRIIEAA